MNKAGRLCGVIKAIDSSEGCLIRKHVGIPEIFIADAWRGMKSAFCMGYSKSTFYTNYFPQSNVVSACDSTLSHYFTKVLATIQDRCAGCLQLGTSVATHPRLYSTGRKTQGFSPTKAAKTFYAHLTSVKIQRDLRYSLA